MKLLRRLLPCYGLAFLIAVLEARWLVAAIALMSALLLYAADHGFTAYERHLDRRTYAMISGSVEDALRRREAGTDLDDDARAPFDLG